MQEQVPSRARLGPAALSAPRVPCCPTTPSGQGGSGESLDVTPKFPETEGRVAQSLAERSTHGRNFPFGKETARGGDVPAAEKAEMANRYCDT
jgi:hypothetical protein